MTDPSQFKATEACHCTSAAFWALGATQQRAETLQRALLSTELGQIALFQPVSSSSSTRQKSLPPKTKKANYFSYKIQLVFGFESSINNLYVSLYFSLLLLSLLVVLNDTVAQWCLRENGIMKQEGEKEMKTEHLLREKIFSDGGRYRFFTSGNKTVVFCHEKYI